MTVYFTFKQANLNEPETQMNDPAIETREATQDDATQPHEG